MALQSFGHLFEYIAECLPFEIIQHSGALWPRSIRHMFSFGQEVTIALLPLVGTRLDYQDTVSAREKVHQLKSKRSLNSELVSTTPSFSGMSSAGRKAR
jgi:hypothetical protein